MNEVQTPHPSTQDLLAFSHGRLLEPEFSAIEEHVRHCEQCCIWMAAQEDHTLLHLAREVATVDVLKGATVKIDADDTFPNVLQAHARYRLIERIGSGGMGAVYKAEHRLMHREVALKVVHPRWLTNENEVQRFQREVRMAAKLSHPNIVTSYDADQAAGIHFLVMEYVDGMSLEQRVHSSGPVDIQTACDWIRQVLAGLQHSHERGMTHRDIKPANLMVTLNGQIKILDFGLSRLAEEPLPPATTGRIENSTQTRADVILGTPDYIAPEQIESSRQATIQADIYALGCTFFYLLAGRSPYSERSIREKLRAHQQLPFPDIREIRTDVPPDLVGILSRMTAKNLAERFQEPSQVLMELEPLSLSLSGLAQTPIDTLNSQIASRRQWMKRAGIACIVLGTLTTIWATSGFSPLGGMISPKPLRVLVMLPRQGLWFPDYQALVTGAQKTGSTLTFAGLGIEASQTLSSSAPGIAVPDRLIDSDLHADDYDAIMFIGYDTSDFAPGGPAGEHTKRLVNEFQYQKKVLASLCSGQRLLAQHGALRGKRVAASESVTAEEIRFEGGEQSSESLVLDGHVVTSDATDDASSLLRAIQKIANP